MGSGEIFTSIELSIDCKILTKNYNTHTRRITFLTKILRLY